MIVARSGMRIPGAGEDAEAWARPTAETAARPAQAVATAVRRVVIVVFSPWLYVAAVTRVTVATNV